jgi:hypothetical protein
MKLTTLSTRTLVLAHLLLLASQVFAQDMEPRRWTHLPTDLNIVGFGAGATDADIYFDPVMQIENGKADLYSLAGSYIRTFEWLGRSSRVDFRVPYAYGRWDGLVEGEYRSIRRHGFKDPRIRLSMNLYGAPPMSGKEFMGYRMNNPVSTTVGAAISLTLPVGEYYPEYLINLGGNRYVIRPQIGVLHQRGPWQFEVTTTLSFYSDNDEYYPGSHHLEQEHLWFFQGHIIRSFARGIWASASGGFSYGGVASLDGRDLGNNDRTRYVSFSLGMPLSRQQSVKVTYINAETNVVIGSDSNSLLFSWSMNWGE